MVSVFRKPYVSTMRQKSAEVGALAPKNKNEKIGFTTWFCTICPNEAALGHNL